MNEQMQETQEKKAGKKFYQKWWFWLIVVICGIVIISVNSGEESSEDTEKNTSQNVSTEAPSEIAQPSVEDYKNSCNSYSYQELARNPDTYKKKNIVIRGEVVQVIEDGKKVKLRVYMDSVFDDTIYVFYTLKNGEGRILEGDVLDIYGTFEGLISYETVLGAKVTVPSVNAKYIEQIS